MGSSQSQESQQFLESFKGDYSVLRTINDKKFGEATVYKGRTEETLILMKTYWSKNTEDHKSCLQQCQSLSQIEHNNLVRLLGYHQNASNQICGDFTKVSIYLEYFENSLEKEIERRIEEKKTQYFCEQELWLILYESISALYYLETRKRLHGDVRPHNFLLTTNGTVKLIEAGSLLGESSAFLKTYYNKEKTYLAPEVASLNRFMLQLLPLVEQTQFTNHIQAGLATQKSDIFALGVTLLECTTLYQGKDLYKFEENSYRLDCQLLEQLVLSIPNLGYTNFWFRVLRELVQERPEDRPTFHDVLEVLRPYEESILKRKVFEFQSLEPSYRSSDKRSLYRQESASQQQPSPNKWNPNQNFPFQNQNQLIFSQIPQQYTQSPQIEQQYISTNMNTQSDAPNWGNIDKQLQQAAFQVNNLQPPLIVQMPTPPPQNLQQPTYYTQSLPVDQFSQSSIFEHQKPPPYHQNEVEYQIQQKLQQQQDPTLQKPRFY